jgi:hypothetical protein
VVAVCGGCGMKGEQNLPRWFSGTTMIGDVREVVVREDAGRGSLGDVGAGGTGGGADSQCD